MRHPVHVTSWLINLKATMKLFHICHALKYKATDNSLCQLSAFLLNASRRFKREVSFEMTFSQ